METSLQAFASVQALASVLGIGLVLFLSRRLPLTGRKRWAALIARSLALLLVILSTVQRFKQVVRERPQQIVYAVDLSASVDAEQRDWIARRLASLEDVRPRRVRRAVIGFGAQPELLEDWGTAALDNPDTVKALLSRARVAGEKTNIEEALLMALRLAAGGGGARVVLFSDGRETSGSAARVLAHIRRLGLNVYPEPVPVSLSQPIIWQAISVPAVVQRASPLPIRLILYNGTSSTTSANITVSIGGVAIKRQQLPLRPGWRALTTSVPAVQQGTLALDVRVTTPSGFDDHRTAYTEVEGPPHILFVDPQTTVLPLAAQALEHREFEVSLIRPEELPTETSSLVDYDAVFLFNVAKSSLTEQQVQALRTFLEESGGGLVMAGLGGELSHEILTPSPLDALLPVTFEAKGLQEIKRRVCMILLIDRSASMLGPRLAATKRASIALVNQLAVEDIVGVLAFDTKPYIVAEMQPVGDARNVLVEKLVKLHSTGGTDILPALIAAQNRLNPIDAQIKHVILLSDGNTPFNLGLYRALMESFRQDGISISAIGVGSAFINDEYLEWVTNQTGGMYYQLQTLEDLPRLVAQDAEDQLGKLPFAEGKFRPQRAALSDLFLEPGDWPAVSGYLTATAKPDATVEASMHVGETPDPLLARWSVGLGRVAVFTSDADARWSADWIRWDGFEGWISQLLRWAMRPRFSEELFVSVQEKGNAQQLVVEGPLSNPQGMLMPASGAQGKALSLVQTTDFRWEASLDGTSGGWHQLALTSQPDGQAPRFAKRWVQVGTPPETVEAAGQAPNEPWLREAARLTAGLYAAPDIAFLPPSTSLAVQEPVAAWWLPLVLLILLVEIALRGSSML